MPKRRRLLWYLYPSYLLIILLSLVSTAWFASDWLYDVYVEKMISDLSARASLVGTCLARDPSPDQRPEIDAIVKKLGASTATRFTIVLPSGEVFADSEVDPSILPSHAERPEIIAALKGETARSVRRSYTVKTDMLYVAVLVKRNEEVVAVARAAIPVSDLTEILRPVLLNIALAGLLIAAFAGLASLLVSRPLIRTIREMKEGAQRFAAGDLFYRMDGGSYEETGALAEAMNRMAERFHVRLAAVTSQRDELEAVLRGMVEAVLVVDEHETIVRLNRSAETLFRVDAKAVRGRRLLEAIRNNDLRRFIRKVLDSETPIEESLTLPGEPELLLQAKGSFMKDGSGRPTGAVVVLNDMTRLRALEKIRKDFVANVSHELKTPVTSIKGFLETLNEGAIEDPENARRFLDIVIKQADRLGMIIEDLLSLSRIEQEAEKGSISLEPGSLAQVFEAVSKTCRDRAVEKEISLEWNCDADLIAMINPTLLEQALVNLIDNAVKYSEPGKSVTMSAELVDGEIVILVRDQGFGIPREHLNRVFERFYRLDKGRSREVGGTGLGLAIVKHIVNAHNGKILVESVVGRGSTFSIRLPAI
ncbi:MAG: PAS domain-containing protein [Desulfomonile tiedjei]|nr:PAS domain-containing protein [Desulfomonile tiedjei]